MTNTRRTEVVLNYKGVNISSELAPFLSSFSYSDNEGKSDEIQIELQDRDKKWQDPWLPGDGDEIKATIKTINWNKEGEVLQLNCGTFFVDDVGFSGPPDKITIKAMSVPFVDGGKGSKHTRAWENASLSTIAGDVATSAGLSLLYDAPNYAYDRVDQLRQTDLAFIKRMAKKEGLSTKVTDGKLIIYDELTYESKGTVRTIKRGEDDVITYDFSQSVAEKQYKKVEVSYFDDTKKKNVKYIYIVPKVENGPTLRVNKRAKNLGEAMRWAKAEARAKNKKSKSGNLTLMGTTKLVQGLTVQLEKFGAFDGKYFIESCSHGVTGKYETAIEIREVLSY